MNSHREGQWLASPSYTAQRGGADVTEIVLHTMVATESQANARFQQAGEHVSAHYGVELSGNIVQWVDECDAAWHAGDWDTNMASIGIEHEDEGNYDGVRPDSLYTASAGLVRRICARYQLPIDRAHIRAHREIVATGCPDRLDIDRIVREAAAPPGQGVIMDIDQAAVARFAARVGYELIRWGEPDDSELSAKAQAVAAGLVNLDAVLADMLDGPEGARHKAVADKLASIAAEWDAMVARLSALEPQPVLQ